MLPSVPTGVTNGTVDEAFLVEVEVEVTVTTVPLVGRRGTTADCVTVKTLFKAVLPPPSAAHVLVEVSQNCPVVQQELPHGVSPSEYVQVGVAVAAGTVTV